jgi:hypothetical protein
MNALQQLAEREFPISANSAENTISVLIQGEKRLALIRGAKLMYEFCKWWKPGHDDYWEENIENFLTSKLKGDEKLG